jgi:predicted DCC family thiol-disulfide oxidoreductase YuxK
LGANRYGLTSEAASLWPLAAMRIIVGLVLLAQVQVLWYYRELLLDPEGPLPWSITDSWVDPLLPQLSDLVPLFAAAGLGTGAVVAVVLAIHALAAAFMVVGYHTGVAVAVAWLTFMLVKNSSLAYSYGISWMLLISLFYCLVGPVGRVWSIDALRRRAGLETPTAATSWVVVLRLHLCLLYAAGGFAKAMGEQWWSGEALWRALYLPQFRQFDPAPLASWPALLQAATIATILSQLLYPVLVWTRLRVVTVLVVEALHLGIAIFLGLWMFSAVMIALNTAAWGEALWASISRRLGRVAPVPPRVGRLLVIYDGGCPFCSDYVRYQRLAARAEAIDLVDARARPDVLAEHGIDPQDMEDGMVAIADGKAHRGAAATHLLACLSEEPRKWWVRELSFLNRSSHAARLAYPILRAGRRIALAWLGISRFPGGAPEATRREG